MMFDSAKDSKLYVSSLGFVLTFYVALVVMEYISL